ncbi:HDOD domain-containing protein [Bermanella sp. R86510]|uniref:aminoacyl-tRNA deacylase and HDOD domain-containing protein n=1 Tax=unclassified Bermanella TaxID=2627862 RepID=UPI0037C5611B
MGLPSRIQKVLDEWKVTYSLCEPASVTIMSSVYNMPGLSESSAQLSILEDEHGRIQVIFPASHILDLNKIYTLTARQFTPVAPDKVKRLCEGLSLQTIPALPQVTGLETYVDQHLLDLNVIHMNIDGEQDLAIKKEDFQTLISSARVGNYCSEPPLPVTPEQHWSKQDLSQINRAVESFTQLRIHQRLEETLDIPPMPETAKQIIDLRMDPNAETEQLAKLVQRDPGLAAQVISWANSPYYGISGSITSVQEAVIRVLGFDLVINLALGLSLGRTLSVPKTGPRGYTPYWQQSVYTAALMSELVKAIPNEKRPTQGMAYLCGLLHNFGFLILAHVFPPHFQLISRHMEANPHINRYSIEQHLINLTREQISSNLLKHWGLPYDVCTAIRYQNEPGYRGDYATLASMLYVAARMLSPEKLSDAPLEAIPDDIKTFLQLDETKAQEALERVLSSKEDLQEMARQLQA